MRPIKDGVELAWWQQGLLICGYEGEEGAPAGDGGTGTPAGEGGTGTQGDPGAGDTEDGEDGDDEIPDNLEEIKAALKKERQNSREAKSLKRQLTQAQKKLDEAAEADKSEKEKAESRAQKAEERAAKLATGYKARAIDSAIERAARDAGFHDPSDAIAQVSRNDITVEQDEDDPSDVTIDKKSVVAAVKALAAAKKHLLKSDDDGEGEPSGGKFNKGPNGKKGLSEEELRKRYPALG